MKWETTFPLCEIIFFFKGKPQKIVRALTGKPQLLQFLIRMGRRLQRSWPNFNALRLQCCVLLLQAWQSDKALPEDAVLCREGRYGSSETGVDWYSAVKSKQPGRFAMTTLFMYIYMCVIHHLHHCKTEHFAKKKLLLWQHFCFCSPAEGWPQNPSASIYLHPATGFCHEKNPF